MRYFLLLPVLFALAGCGSSPVMISDSPVYDSPVGIHRAHSAPKVEHPARADQHEWQVYEDRFITTHSIDASVDALHVTPDQINARLNVLNGK